MHNLPRTTRVLISVIGALLVAVVAVAGIAIAKPFTHSRSLDLRSARKAVHTKAVASVTDSDRDGLSNTTEVKRTRTNPYKADTDGDGLSDGTEVNVTKTNPRKADSDGDGFNDGAEIAAGTDPWNRASFPSPSTPNPPTPPAPPAPPSPPADTTPPETTITTGPLATTTETSASFSFGSSESGSTFACRLDSGSFASCSSPRSYGGLAAGKHSFEVRATDGAGNVDPTPARREWTIEAPPPPVDPVEAIWVAPADAQASVPVTLDGADSSGEGPLSCTWSFENQSGSIVFQEVDGCTIDFTFESSGLKYVRLTVEGAGGEADSNKQSFTVAPAETEPPPPDTTPPDTTISSSPPATTTSTSASFSFSSSEPGSSFECKLDAGVYGSCVSPKSYTGLAVGSHTFTVRAKDAAGNVDASPASRTWAIEGSTPPPSDTTPPETTIESGPAAETTEATASFSFSSSEPGSSFECKLDAGAYGSCVSPKSYTGLAVGSHTFTVRAKDAAGNVDASPASRTWTVQTGPPPPPPPSGCVSGATQATTAAAVRSAVQGSHNVCVTAAVGDVNLNSLGSRPVVVSTEGSGSMGSVDINDTTNLTIRNARLRSVELWYADHTTIENSTLGGTSTNRTYDNLVNINVSRDVTIKGNELAWTLAGVDQTAGYGIRSPGNTLGYNDRLHIEGNYIHNIAADGIQGFGRGEGVVVDRNRIDYIGQEPGSNEHSDAIQAIDHGSGFRLTNNWISHEGYYAPGQPSGGSGTLYVHGESNGSMLIENNLFSESQGRVLITGLGTGGTTISNLTIRRNTFLEDGKSYASFPSFHWAVTSGSNNLIERNVAQDEDGGFASQGSLSAGTWVENLWRDRDAGNALTFDASGNCTSAACNPAGQEAIGYRKPSGVSW